MIEQINDETELDDESIDCGEDTCVSDPLCRRHEGGDASDETDEPVEDEESEEDESRPVAFRQRLTLEAFTAQLWARVEADHGDADLRERIAVACEANDAPISAGMVRAIGVRGIVTAAMFANGGDAFGHWVDLEQYAADRWDRATSLASIATDLVDCPSCYVLESHHSNEYDPRPFPCDPEAYAAKIAAEAEETRRRYAQGAAIGGYPGYAKHGEFIVTRSVIGTKKPSWCKAAEFSVRWDVDFDTHPGYAIVEIPRTSRAEYGRTPAEKIFIEFKRADRVAGAQASLFA